MSEPIFDAPVLVGKYSTQKLPEIYPHKTFREINIEAAQKVYDVKLSEWQKLKKELDKLVVYSVKNKQALPDNYWQAEHRAKVRLDIADQILKAMKEI